MIVYQSNHSTHPSHKSRSNARQKEIIGQPEHLQRTIQRTTSNTKLYFSIVLSIDSNGYVRITKLQMIGSTNNPLCVLQAYRITVEPLLTVTSLILSPHYYAGQSLRAVTCNTCYDWVCLIFPWRYRWNCPLLKEFTHKVTNLLWVWRTRVQANENLMTALLWPLFFLSCRNAQGYSFL